MMSSPSSLILLKRPADPQQQFQLGRFQLSQIINGAKPSGCSTLATPDLDAAQQRIDINPAYLQMFPEFGGQHVFAQQARLQPAEIIAASGSTTIMGQHLKYAKQYQNQSRRRATIY